jgi:cysteine-rich repeat protein
MVFALRRAVALVAFMGSSSLTACFDVKDAPPLGESSTGPSVTTEPGTTMEPDETTTTPDPTTGEAPESSTGPVDPETSTGPVDPDTSSSSSSSGPPLGPMCGDGNLDLENDETCDDGNLDDGDLCDASCQVETVVLAFTGGVQMLDVPDWVDSLEVEAWGAQGGGSSCSDGVIQLDDGGLGGEVTGVLPRIGGTTLAIRVGGQGIVDGAGGYNGGGNGGLYGGGGGGATDVRTGAGALGDRLFVAAGGGAGKCGGPDHGEGGNGGGLSGQAGISFQGLPPGGGGTQAAGGSPGEYCTPGVLGQGGSAMADPYHVGGGGGGYYGGGGGYGAGGGGGSSYLGVLLNGSTMPGQREGDGELRLTPIAAR